MDGHHVIYCNLFYFKSQYSNKRSFNLLKKFFGIVGFEPTTPCSQSRCSTKLSYIPNKFMLLLTCIYC